ncbi:MAG: hypothetical protein CVT67_03805 [Actinobacteria bacterium HGW-Actinobacteria-7]|jgi:hypothetical protein|nr:MAG: hypothetical protein CVT67_03805 [Actinobacteria bacterium HGW-Actinobacteria-7]
MPAQKLNALQQTLDSAIAEWPGVHSKSIFGHRGYVLGGKMIGFLADEGVAVKVPGPEIDAAYAIDGVVPFAYGEHEMRGWPVLPLRNDDELSSALSALEQTSARISQGEL